METNQIIVLAVGGVAVVGAVIYMTRGKSSGSTGTTVIQQPVQYDTAAFQPTATSFAPIPVGANLDTSAHAPAGVSAAQIVVAQSAAPVGIVAQGNPDYSPPGVNPTGLEVSRTSNLSENTDAPTVVAVEHGASGQLAKTNGVAKAPTGIVLPTVPIVKPTLPLPVIRPAVVTTPTIPATVYKPPVINVPTEAPVPAKKLSPTETAIDTMYQALFGRKAEQAGLDYWAGRVSGGTADITSLPALLTQGARGSDIAAEANIAPDLLIAFRNR